MLWLLLLLLLELVKQVLTPLLLLVPLLPPLLLAGSLIGVYLHTKPRTISPSFPPSPFFFVRKLPKAGF